MKSNAGALSLLLLASCAGGAPSKAVPAPLQRFADAAQFLAPGFESYEFAIDDEPDFTSEVENYLHVLVARSGSDFQKPKNLGAGRCRGVEVRDYGAVRVPVPWWDAGEPTERIAGVPVWLGRGDALNFDQEEPLWTAIVDARFHVRSHDRELLEAALLRTGRLDRVLQPFAPVSLLAEDVSRVVCLLPRSGDASYWNRPIPIEPMVVALCPPRRILMFHRSALPAEFGAGPEELVASRTIDGWTVDELALSEKKTRTWIRLWFSQVFGLAIFL